MSGWLRWAPLIALVAVLGAEAALFFVAPELMLIAPAAYALLFWTWIEPATKRQLEKQREDRKRMWRNLELDIEIRHHGEEYARRLLLSALKQVKMRREFDEWIKDPTRPAPWAQ